jgi:hypothetical protein
MKDLPADKLAIYEMVENRVPYRAEGVWEYIASAWHLGG